MRLRTCDSKSTTWVAPADLSHLLLPGGYPGDDFTAHLAKQLLDRFGIDHVTVQIETDPAYPYAIASDEVL
jgi:cobalt-zinc-cadmium efflux system protein